MPAVLLKAFWVVQLYTIVYKGHWMQHHPISTAYLGKTIKKMKGYLLVKCRVHQQPLPSTQGFQRVQRTSRKTLRLSPPPEKQQGKRHFVDQSSKSSYKVKMKVMNDNCSTHSQSWVLPTTSEQLRECLTQT